MTQTKKPDALAILRAEKQDFENRRDLAQMNADNASRQMNAAQATMQNALRDVLIYDAAAQAFAVAIGKLTPPVEPKERKPRARPPAKPAEKTLP